MCYESQHRARAAGADPDLVEGRAPSVLLTIILKLQPRTKWGEMGHVGFRDGELVCSSWLITLWRMGLQAQSPSS